MLRGLEKVNPQNQSNMTDGQSAVYLGVKPHLGFQDQIFVTVTQLRVC
jgi:hypothetical protein